MPDFQTVNRLPFLIFTTFFVIHTFVFMYQRATLTIARVLGRVNIQQAQMILTPNWMGLLGAISTAGLYGSYIFIWLQVGLIWAIALFILNHLINTFIPIPSKFFYNIIERHLVKEIRGKRDGEERALLIGFSAQVKQIMENYKVS